MSTHRRDFFNLVGGSIAAAGIAALSVKAHSHGSMKITAIAFDGFPIIDPRPVFARAEDIFSGRGAELSNAWRTRQFEYSWLRTMSGNYADFWQVTEQAAGVCCQSPPARYVACAAKAVDGDLSRSESLA